MKLNLTDYYAIFSVFDLSAVEEKNPQRKAQNCYQATQAFLQVLERHQLTFPGLELIRHNLAEINDYFADFMLVISKGRICAHGQNDEMLALHRMKYSYPLTKHNFKSTEQVDEFLNLLNNTTAYIGNTLRELRKPRTDTTKKMNEMDRGILVSSLDNKLPFEYQLFGGSVMSRAPLPKAKLDIFMSGSSYPTLTTPIIEDEAEIVAMLSTLKQFTVRAGALEHRFGIDLELVQAGAMFSPS